MEGETIEKRREGGRGKDGEGTRQGKQRIITNKSLEISRSKILTVLLMITCKLSSSSIFCFPMFSVLAKLQFGLTLMLVS